MKYNDIITYNHNNVTYTGIVKINVPGILNAIILNNVSVAISTNPDYSNATVVGVVTYDFTPSGILTIEATQDQAQALVGAEIIYINSASGEISVENVQ